MVEYKKFVEAGLSVIPVNPLDKKPFFAWKKFQNDKPTREDIIAFSRFNPANVAIVCGIVSGNVEVIDFDNKDNLVSKRFNSFINDNLIVPIIDKYNLPYEKTPSGGYHLFYRSSFIEGNLKLAKVNNDTAIETRGEGGYVICAPSINYELLNGSLYDIPLITPEDRNTLLNTSRSFNQEVKQEKTSEHTGNTIGEEFSKSSQAPSVIKEILIAAGWKLIHTSNGNEQWQRPNKSEGTSASYNGQILNVFSSNAAPFEPKGYTNFQVLGLLKFNGDFKAAAKYLASQGFGKSQDTFFIRKNDDSKYFIDYSAYISFLSAHGYYKYFYGGAISFVKLQDNLVDEITVPQISDFIRNYIKTEIKNEKMLSFIICNESKLFTEKKLYFLETLPNNFTVDTVDASFLFFLNCAVKVTASQVAVYEYKELQFPVWRNLLIERNFNYEILSDKTQGEFEKFLHNITGSKFPMLQSAIGYLLHRFKQDSQSKTIVFSDEVIPESEDMANGGTGKSLVAKYISMYRKVIKIGSKNIDFKSQFVWQDVNFDSNIILFDDVNYYFPFRYLFDVVSGDLKVERKNKAPFIIKYNDSPKFIITTNHSITGIGDSYERRKFEIEFLPHYTASHTPRDEFNHDFFTEWSEYEQSLADYFAIRSISCFLVNGLMSLTNSYSAARFRQAISETSRPFIDFIFEKIAEDAIQSSVWFDRKEIFNDYKIYIDDTQFKLQGFTRFISKFCSVFKLQKENTKTFTSRLTRLKGNIKELAAEFYKSTGEIQSEMTVTTDGQLEPQQSELPF